MRNARPTPNPRDGDPFARWFTEHGARLRIWFGRRVGCPETAADLAQEVCVRLAACAGARGEEQLRGLAYRIANQILIDHHRRTAVRARVAQQASDLGAIASPAPLGRNRCWPADKPSRALREALAELPVACRTAFLLQGLDGLSYAQTRLGSGSPSAWWRSISPVPCATAATVSLRTESLPHRAPESL